MNFKKIISIIAAAALCVTAAGCRGGEESSAPLESVDGSEISNTVEAVAPSDIKPLESYAEDSLVYRAESMNAMEFTAAMQPGWNLGNTLDATGGETSWGNPKATPELIQKIKDEGFNSIRIPITWWHMMNEENVIDASYLARTKEVINYALDADLLVFVNIHHDSWQWLNAITPDENDANYLKFRAIWEQLAEAYKDYPRAVIFESINEPRFDKESTYAECLDMMNKACVEIVRASGGNNAERLIVLPTKDTNSEQKYLDQLYGTITEINDPNIIATVHYYGYWPFSVNIAGETEFKGISVTDIDGLVSRLKTTFIDNGIPVIIGEWGLLGFDTALDTVEHGEILKFFEYFCNAVRENGLTTMWWDNGQHINRYSYEWADPSLMAIIKQSMQGRSSTAERDFINLFEGAVEDKQLKLSLNGNTLAGIRSESGGALSEDSYTLTEDTLTFKADYISALVTDPAQYGRLETLYLEFSAGPDWTVYVYNTSTPEFTEVEGRKGALTIPCDFKGTQLKTVEAKYISGGSNSPGSQNWTTFKQYGDQFTTVTDGVRFTNNFFNETAGECEIQFIFYFWNDTTVEYNLTVSDGKAVGAPVTAE